MLRSTAKLVLILAATAGYLVWVFLFFDNGTTEKTVCFFRNIYGIPCPACGTTHGLIALANGEFLTALKYNPNAYFIALSILFTVPFTTAYIFTGKGIPRVYYTRVKTFIKSRPFLITFFSIEAAIWCYKLSEHFGFIY